MVRIRLIGIEGRNLRKWTAVIIIANARVHRRMLVIGWNLFVCKYMAVKTVVRLWSAEVPRKRDSWIYRHLLTQCVVSLVSFLFISLQTNLKFLSINYNSPTFARLEFIWTEYSVVRMIHTRASGFLEILIIKAVTITYTHSLLTNRKKLMLNLQML